METQIKEKGLERANTGEKRKLEGSSRPGKKNKFSKSYPNGKKFGGNNEAR